MSNFNLSKNYAKPGDVLNIQGSCVHETTTFQSSDDSIAVVSGTGVTVVGIGEATITENTTPSLDCNNVDGVILTATEDGKPFFMSKADYNTFTNYELVLVCVVLFVAFLIRFAKNS